MNKVYNKKYKETIYTHTLDNGLKIIMVPKKDYHQVSAFFTAKFGGCYYGIDVNGTKLLSGLAHFLEHRLFDNPKGPVLDLFDRLGASYSNAFTSFDLTTFIFRSSTNINKCINLLLDFVQEADFSEEKVENEKKIIVQEYHMTNDRPETKIVYGLLGNSCINYPFEKQIIGTVEDIEATSKQQLLLAHSTYYNPNNMFLTIVGAFSPKSMLRVIEKNQNAKSFKNIKAPKFSVLDPFKVKKEYEEISLGLPYYKVAIGYKYESINYANNQEKVKDELLFSYVLHLLFDSSSYLSEELLRKKVVNTPVEFDSMCEKGFRLVMINADCDNKEVFIKEIDNIINNAKEYINKENFESLKRKKYSQFVKSLDSTLDFAEKMTFAYLDDLSCFEQMDIEMSIKYEELVAFAENLKKYVKTVFVVH